MNTESTITPITVEVVDCHQITLWGVCKLLQQDNRYQVCAAASKSLDALKLAISSNPDVIVLDPQLEDEDGMELVSALIQKTKSKVIVFTGSRDLAFLDQYAAEGVRGIINKSEPIDTLLKAIEKVHLGKLWLGHNSNSKTSPKIAKTDAPNDITTEQEKLKKLTRREEKVTHAIQMHSEKTLKQIAQSLHISEHTLRNHLASIYSKLGVPNRMELYVFCGKFQKTENSILHPKRRSTDISS